MTRTEKWLRGLVVRETQVFITRRFYHIEIVETVKLFRWTIKETVREVYIPHMTSIEQSEVRVIADAYLELHEIYRRLEQYEKD